MKSEKIEDKVINEMPIYLSKFLLDELYVFQYPVRLRSQTYDDENILKAQVKPNNSQVEIEIGIRTIAPTYDRSFGEQICHNVDGPSRDRNEPQENYYASNIMDKMVLASSKVLGNPKTCAVGVMKEGAFHISPVTNILELKPSFDYLDKAEKHSKLDNKDHLDAGDTEVTKKVTVRFERPETDRSKEMKEKSFGFLQRKLREEPWVSLTHFRYGSELSKFQARHLYEYCERQDEMVNPCSLDLAAFVQQLFPSLSEPTAASKSGSTSNFQSLVALNAMPLQERVLALMQNAGVASFTEITCSVASGRKDEDLSILKTIQQVAVLVQGNWVVKSDVVYPKAGCSESRVSNEILQRARDCILHWFTKNQTITRANITEHIDIPDQDLTRILRGVAKLKGNRQAYEFILQVDHHFLKKYPDVAQRQQMIWQSRYEQLSQHFIKK